MFMMEIVIMLLIGAFVGWLMILIYPGSSFRQYGNIILGILGSAAGYWSLGEMDVRFGSDLLTTLVHGSFGAILLIGVFNLLIPGKGE